MRCCLILLIVVFEELRIRPRQKDRLRRILESCSFSFRGRHCKLDRTIIIIILEKEFIFAYAESSNRLIKMRGR